MPGTFPTRRFPLHCITSEHCRTFVTAFVDYLQDRFPASRVRIRNGLDETVALSFARIILAQQTVISLSTFAFYAAVASFGQVYIRQSHIKNLGGWLVRAARQGQADNIVLFQENQWWLSAKDCKERWGADGADVLLKWWFRSE